jgi:Bacterial transcriptional activator domain
MLVKGVLRSRGEGEMEFLVLGSLEVVSDGRSLPLGGAKQRAVLAVLVLNANRVVSIDQLIDALWGERAPRALRTRSRSTCPSCASRFGFRDRLHPTRSSSPRDGATSCGSSPRRSISIASSGWRRRVGERSPPVNPIGPPRGSGRPSACGAGRRWPSWRTRRSPEIARIDDLKLSAVEDRIEADLALGRHAELVGELQVLVCPSRGPH